MSKKTVTKAMYHEVIMHLTGKVRKKGENLLNFVWGYCKQCYTGYLKSGTVEPTKPYV